MDDTTAKIDTLVIVGQSVKLPIIVRPSRVWNAVCGLSLVAMMAVVLVLSVIGLIIGLGIALGHPTWSPTHVLTGILIVTVSLNIGALSGAGFAVDMPSGRHEERSGSRNHG